VFAVALDVQVAHVVAGVGVEAGDGEGVAQLFDGPGQQGDGFLAEFQDGLLGAGSFFVEGFGQVQQQHDGDVAAVGAVAHVDARVRVGAALEVDEGADGHVQVQFAAFFLVADADLVLGLEQVEDALQALGQGGVLLQQLVDVGAVALGVQGLVDADPVRPVGLALVVPLRVMARRQALEFLAGFQLALWSKASSSSPSSMNCHIWRLSSR
jgi:hypothetical protein